MVWHLDEESDGYPVGTPYYQNTVTQTMLWDEPAELLDREAEASQAAGAEEAEPPTPSKEEMMAAMKKGKQQTPAPAPDRTPREQEPEPEPEPALVANGVGEQVMTQLAIAGR